MAQAYLALRDDAGNYLITQKRLTNNWWSGRESKGPSIVNQAGQYSLPGGRVDPMDGNPHTAAIREFKEETGIDIGDMKGSHVETRSFDGDGKMIGPGRAAAFHVVVYQTSQAGLEKVCATCKTNVKPAEGMPGPAGRDVKDWEIGSAHIVPGNELHNKLGVRQELSVKELGELEACDTKRRHDCSCDKEFSRHLPQKIDWYGRAAKSLKDQPEPSPQVMNSQNVGNNNLPYGERSQARYGSNQYAQRRRDNRPDPYRRKTDRRSGPYKGRSDSGNTGHGL